MRALLLAALACAAVAVPHAQAGCVDEFGKPKHQFDPYQAGLAVQYAEDETLELVNCVR